MKVIASFTTIFILFLTTECEVIGQKGSIELDDIFDAIGDATRAMTRSSAKELPAVKIDLPPVIDGELNDAAW